MRRRTVKYVFLLLLALAVAGLTLALGESESAFGQDPVCSDNPGAPMPTEIWVDVREHYVEHGKDRPFVDSFAFEEYIRGVVLGELGPAIPVASKGTWHEEALKAQAVAIRTFTWYRLKYAGSYPEPHEMTDDQGIERCGFYDGGTDAAQVFRPYYDGASPGQYQDIVEATAGVYLTYNDAVIHAEYSSDHTGDWTVDDPGNLYLEEIYDPIPSYAPGPGHGRGLSQYRAQAWVEGKHKQSGFPQWEHYEQILVHYYTGVHLRDGSGNQLTPTDRWNPIIVDFGATGAIAPKMYFTGTYPVDVWAQNTGTGGWSGTSYCLSYYWEGSGGTYEGTTQVCLGGGEGVPPGEDHTFNALSITPPSGAADGAYTLIIEVKGDDRQSFRERRATQGYVKVVNSWCKTAPTRRNRRAEADFSS